MIAKKLSFTSLLIALIVFMVGCSTDKNTPKEIPTTTKKPATTTTRPPTEPKIETQVMLDNLSQPWDIAFTDDQTLLFTEKTGALSMLRKGATSKIAEIKDVRDEGEGGLLGLDVDVDFKKNGFLYICYNSKSANDVRVARYVFDGESSSIKQEKMIVSGIPSKSSGRHSGCRIRSATDGTIFIGTGDAANSNNPQSPTNFGGKILRVDRNGNGVEGNLGSPFDPRIFNYGHRNVQGIALFDKPRDGIYGLSVEHGPGKDDEVNLIKNGNFGWSPTGDYNEEVPMTDKYRFPESISAVWSSGEPTIAPSGATLISGDKWGTYNGALAIAVLKDKKVKILKFDKNFGIEFEVDILSKFGRIRSVVQGPDGNLYIATDDATDGKIIKVSPKTTS